VIEPTADRVEVAARPEEIWAVLEDPSALARVLPDAESVTPEGPDRVRIVLASRVGFLTLRADIIARYVDPQPPRHLRLVLDGHARGLSGEIHASIPFDIEPVGTDRSEIRYSVALEMTGRLASMGGGLIRTQLPQQVRELVRNLEREAIRAREARS
jgi:2-furoyl-CoA dehydrogenase large subunit